MKAHPPKQYTNNTTAYKHKDSLFSALCNHVVDISFTSDKVACGRVVLVRAVYEERPTNEIADGMEQTPRERLCGRVLIGRL